MRAANSSMDLLAGDGQFLLVSTPTDFSGFVVLNGNPQASYNRSYARFKEVYRCRHDEASTKTLSFVLCRTDAGTADDSFYGDVETDVYFCRKYVIKFQDVAELLSEELHALPFLPLPEEGVAGIQRPPSAQTLLHSLGLPAALGRKIVVPRESSARRIVDDLLGGSLPMPKLEGEAAPKDTPVAILPAITRIASLRIEAFRAYRERQEFDVDADITVLYGLNGLGKTSFFDAIDYVCTGQIGRFCEHRIPHDTLATIARHLDCAPGSGEVSMVTRAGTKQSKLVRTVDNWDQAEVGMRHVDRAGVLQHLSSARWQDKRPRVENLAKLFRATHLFSQTDPQLMSAFLADSVISFEILSRMLAMDDYASGLQKLGEVMQCISTDMAAKAKEQETLSLSIADIEARLKSFKKAEVSGSSTSINKLLSEIRAEVIGQDDDVSGQIPLVSAVRGWRSLVDGRLAALLERMQLLQSLIDRLPDVVAARTTIEALDRQLREAETFLGDRASGVTGASDSHKAATATLESARTEVSRAESACGRYRGCIKALDKSKAIAAARAKRLEAVNELARSEEEACVALKNAAEAHSRAADLLLKTSAELQAASEKSARLGDLASGVLTWQEQRARLTQSAARRDTLCAQAADLESKLGVMHESIASEQQRLAEVTADYDSQCRDQDQLTRLLDNVETYIRNSVCPLCGKDHQSESALLEHIRSQKSRRSEGMEKLAAVKSALTRDFAQSRDRIATLDDERGRTKGLLQSVLKGIEDAASSVNAYEGRAREAHLDPDEPEFSNALIVAARAAVSEVKRLQSGCGNLRANAETLAAAAASQQERAASLGRKKLEEQKAVSEMDDEVAVCRAVLIEAGLAADCDKGAVTQHLTESSERLENLMLQMHIAAEQVVQAQEVLRKLQSELAAAEKQKSVLLSTRRNQVQVVDQYTRELSKAACDAATTHDQLSRAKADLEKERTRLDRLLSRLRLAETTLDAAARTAAETEMRSHLATAAQQRECLHADLEKLGKAGVFCDAIAERLKRQAATAIDDHIAAYGPLTTIIQRRLRAVFGFGDVRLMRRGESIHVEVDRGENTLRPIDYFSDSQKQILMLSIFLAGRMTQTWSGFAPVLMDDPVTHFDDLNAYAFVELVRGLLQSQPGRRQFIISTCEERLFRLMREKFGGVTGGARFYQLHCLTKKGPEIERLA
jgi:DNA repair protein SbcC/Rad50